LYAVFHSVRTVFPLVQLATHKRSSTISKSCRAQSRRGSRPRQQNCAILIESACVLVRFNHVAGPYRKRGSLCQGTKRGNIMPKSIRGQSPNPSLHWFMRYPMEPSCRPISNRRCSWHDNGAFNEALPKFTHVHCDSTTDSREQKPIQKWLRTATASCPSAFHPFILSRSLFP
jgi:hypothetical protein